MDVLDKITKAVLRTLVCKQRARSSPRRSRNLQKGIDILYIILLLFFLPFYMLTHYPLHFQNHAFQLPLNFDGCLLILLSFFMSSSYRVYGNILVI